LRDRKKANEERSNQAADDLRKSPLPDLSKGERVLPKLIDDWNKEYLTVQDEEQHRFDGLTSDPADNEAKPKEIVDQAAKEAAALENVPDGSIAGFYKNLPLLAQESRELLQELPADGKATASDVRGAKNQEQAIEFMRHGLLKGEAFQHVAGEMAKTMAEIFPASRAASFLGTTAELCEVLRGRELCVGRTLSDDERATKTCELIAKYAFPWKTVKNAILGHAEGGARDVIVEQAELKIKSGACGYAKSRAQDLE
jgi:hypothetical protein